jgi:MYXO-CTERM domain-containing protein
VADACGCLSPPVVSSGDYAVNQRAEQIIFEVEPGWVTAHVLIKYSGKPESFAWIVPVPEVPELSISPSSAFGILDKQTQPQVSVGIDDLCPQSQWSCSYHDRPNCGGIYGADDDSAGGGGGNSVSDAGAGNEPPPVTVIDEKVVGDYQTVTFRASEAQAATQWLRSNGFIVNQTTSIYMEPYVQANMVFVAAKLLPGAGVESIKPLKMRYRAAFPMVPLLLTAVGADPHMTVTTYLYGNDAFRPMGHPLVQVDPKRIARDKNGRLNYPMALALTVDEAGGDGFVVEYRGDPVTPQLGSSSCCSGSYDFCGIGGNNKCECPGQPFDEQDCKATASDLSDGIDLIKSLAQKYTTLTRITTRVSPEEMRFDPTFERDFGATRTGVLQLRGTQESLAGCADQVIDKDKFAAADAMQSCATLYCGIGGVCVTTASGGACACGANTVAQQFTDLDNQPSVTCVPRTPTCDLRAGGEALPDACAGVSCGAGTCVDRNGVAVCACDAGNAAVAGNGAAPFCRPIEQSSESRGGIDYSDALKPIDVCAPAPPTCGTDGWLVKTGTTRPGVDCGGTQPAHWRTVPPPKPVCDDFFGCGCQGGGEAPLPAMALAWICAAVMFRRRRSPRT